MATDVMQTLQDLIRNLLGDKEAAMAYVEDPEGTLAACGLTDGDVSVEEIRQAVGDALQSVSLDGPVRSALQSYSSGSPASGPVAPPATPPAAQPPAETVMQHLNYVTYVSYEGDDYITQTIIDNSTDIDVDVDGEVYGDVTVDTDIDNVTATEGGVAAGDDIDVDGQLNTGDGAVVADEITDSAVNTGTNEGIVAGDDVTDAVVGHDNQVVGDLENSAVGFGEGDTTSFGDADIDDSAVAVGDGDATNVSDNTLDDGSAIGVGGDASGSYTDVDVSDSFNDEVNVEAEDSVVAATTEGDATAEDNVDVDVDIDPGA